MIKAIVFDWDGTLLDSDGYKRENFSLLFKELGGDQEKARELHKRFSGMPRSELFSNVYLECFSKELSNEKYLELSKKFSMMNLHSGTSAEIYPEVVGVLKELEGSYLLFVSSSSVPEELEIMVQKKNVAAYFKEVLGSRPGFSKGKEHVEYLLKKYKLERNQITFIGNDDQDEKIAKSAGVSFGRVFREQPITDLRKALQLAGIH